MYEYIVFFLIVVLAAMLGFFVNKALQAQKFRELRNGLENYKETKNTLAIAERNLIVANVERDKFREAEEKIKSDYFRLTLSFKNLQEDLSKERAILRQQYEVPPEIPRLKESNRLLSIEIDKLRRKMRRWKSKDLFKENKKLRKKLKKAHVKLLELKKDQLTQSDLENYESLYFKIQALSQEAEVLMRQETSEELMLDEEFEEEDTGFFSQQPESRKKMIFQDIIRDPEDKHENNTAFDLENEYSSTDEKGLMDLIDIDSKIYAVLINAGIEDFDDLVETKIHDLRMLLEIAAIEPSTYQYATWPLQARLAQKGDWALIEEFREN